MRFCCYTAKTQAQAHIVADLPLESSIRLLQQLLALLFWSFISFPHVTHFASCCYYCCYDIHLLDQLLSGWLFSTPFWMRFLPLKCEHAINSIFFFFSFSIPCFVQRLKTNALSRQPKPNQTNEEKLLIQITFLWMCLEKNV